jgi:hypothetical protein
MIGYIHLRPSFKILFMTRNMRTTLFSTIAVLLFLGSYRLNQHSYVKEESKPFRVVAKLTENAGYKVAAKWLLILEDQGVTFDLDVTPTTWYFAKQGEVLWFSLAESEYKPSNRLEWLINIPRIILLFLGVIMAILAVASAAVGFGIK